MSNYESNFIELLPKLEDTRISVSKAGVWESEDLSAVEEGLELKNTVKKEISSIPDVWGYVRMFSDIMQDKKDMLHSEYEATWRGVLAMIGLRNISAYRQNIDIVATKVKVNSRQEESIAGTSFRNILERIVPLELLEQDDATEYTVQVVTYDNRPFCITWPDLLLCPAVRLGEINSIDVPWWHDGVMRDPVAFLTEGQKAILVKWLDGIKTSVERFRKDLESGYRFETYGRLRKLLSDYITALGKIKEEAVEEAGHSMRLGFEGSLYSCMDVTYKFKEIKADSTSRVNSNIELVGDKNKRSTAPKERYFISQDKEDMRRQWNKQFPSSKEIRAMGMRTIDDDLGDLTVCNEDDIFTNDLLLIKVGSSDKNNAAGEAQNFFPNAQNINKNFCYRGAIYDVVLPVKEFLLDYYDPTSLNSRLSVREGRDGKSILVTMQLDLLGDNKKRFQLEVVREYAGSNLIFKAQAPLIKIWPNFIIDNDSEQESLWQCYYTYYNNLGDPRHFYAKPYWRSAKDGKECEYGGSKRISDKIVMQAGTNFPEAFVCYLADKGVDGRYEYEKREAGLILIDESKAQHIPSREIVNYCTIGVDFGTTNSIANISVQGEKHRIIFQDRIFTVSNNYGAAVHNIAKAMREYFIPASEQPTGKSKSIRSIINSHSVAKEKGEGNGRDYPLMYDNILFMEENNFDAEDAKHLSDCVNIDAKWGGDKDQTRKFLCLFCMECLAEAVAEYKGKLITWNYSYPQTYNRQEKGDYETIWRDVLEFLNNSIDVQDKKVNRQGNRLSESEAIVSYFKDQGAPITEGVVCWDIGGGSTDVAIWEGNDEKSYQTSVRFAGRDILTNYLWEKKKKVKTLFSCLTCNRDPEGYVKFMNALDALGTTDADKKTFNVMLEYVLKYYEKEVIRNLPVARTKNKFMREVVRDIRFAFAGLFYYMGIVVGYIRKSSDFQGSRLKDHLPLFYIGGNGAKILDWCVQGAFTPGELNTDEFVKLLSDLFRIGIKFVIGEGRGRTTKLERSKEPKNEVAYGLVSDVLIAKSPEIGDEEDEEEDDDIDIVGFKPEKKQEQLKHSKEIIIAGENYCMSGEWHEGIDVIDKQQIENGVRIDLEKIDYFKLFVANFNHRNRMKDVDTEDNNLRTVNFTETEWDLLIRTVNQNLVNNKNHKKIGAEEVSAIVEPIFIVELRNAMLALAQKS